MSEEKPTKSELREEFLDEILDVLDHLTESECREMFRGLSLERLQKVRQAILTRIYGTKGKPHDDE